MVSWSNNYVASGPSVDRLKQQIQLLSKYKADFLGTEVMQKVMGVFLTRRKTESVNISGS